MTALGRTWGGNEKKGAHLIADISFAGGFVTCKDGKVMRSARGLTLEDAWDIHRGKASLVYDRATDRERPWASDEEVSAFLRLVEDPAYEYEEAA